MSNLKNEKSYEKVIDYVTDNITRGDFKIGSRLPAERELALKLNVGRYTVREAMRVMENMGIVSSRRGDGNYISGNFNQSLLRYVSMYILLKKPSFSDINSIRRGLESEALKSFALNASKDEIKKIYLCIEGMKNSDNEKSAQWDNMFHEYITGFSKNSILADFVSVISEAVEKNIGSLWIDISPENKAAICRCHTEIIKAAEMGNLSGALKALSLHYDIVERIFNNREEVL